MASHFRWARLATVACLALAGVACAVPIRVHSYAERGADPSRYRTYDFAPVQPTPTGDPRLDSNPFFNERIQEAVATGMAARGYARAASGAADLLVHFHASVRQDINVLDLDRQRGYCAQEEDCRPFVYEAGTLLMDLVDARTSKLVWRGWAESSVDGVIDNQTWLEAKVDTAVARLLAKLPRRAL